MGGGVMAARRGQWKKSTGGEMQLHKTFQALVPDHRARQHQARANVRLRAKRVIGDG